MTLEYGLLIIAIIMIIIRNMKINCYDRADVMTTRFHNSKRIYTKKSKYQKIEVFKDKNLGHILSIDGDVQLSEYDEINYHEMLVHVPMAYVKPTNVLIIGGGDGGTLREVCKYPDITNIVMVEIDHEVINASKRFFVNFRSAFADPRVTLKIMDAFKYLKEDNGILFDAVFIDVTDFNQSDSLFTQESIQNLKLRMDSDAVLGLNFTSVGIAEPKTPVRVLNESGFGERFKHKRLFQSHQPVFTGGAYTFAFFSDSVDPLDFPSSFPVDDLELETHYYTSALHKASFVLPKRLMSD